MAAAFARLTSSNRFRRIPGDAAPEPEGGEAGERDREPKDRRPISSRGAPPGDPDEKQAHHEDEDQRNPGIARSSIRTGSLGHRSPQDENRGDGGDQRPPPPANEARGKP